MVGDPFAFVVGETLALRLSGDWSTVTGSRIGILASDVSEMDACHGASGWGVDL